MQRSMVTAAGQYGKLHKHPCKAQAVGSFATRQTPSHRGGIRGLFHRKFCCAQKNLFKTYDENKNTSP